MLTKQLKEILSPRIIGVSQDTPVRDAVKIMTSSRISCILVLHDRRPVGILTERAVLSTAVRQGGTFLGRPIREVMSGPLLTATGDMFVYEAYNLLTTKRYRHLVIVDTMGCAVGVVTLSDLVAHLGVDSFSDAATLERIMTRDVRTVSPEDSVDQCLRVMAEHCVSCVVAQRDNMAEGILTERDLARMLADDADLKTLTTDQAMTKPVATVPVSTPVHEAARIMREKNCRRLVVAGTDGSVRGLVTQSDIVRGLEGKYVETLKHILEEKDSRLKELGRDLEEKTLHLEHILHSAAHLGIAATDTDFNVTYFNPAAETILGMPADQVMGRNAKEIHSSQDDRLDRVSQAIRDGGPGSGREFTFTREVGGSLRHLQAHISGIWNERLLLVGFMLLVNDVTKQKQAEETIRFMAYHDMLTGLPNRMLFNDRLEIELARARRGKTALALLVLDLDRFKEVNDTLGHQAGDLLLKELGQRLAELLRASDTVARLGGDEFLFLLPEVQGTDDLLAVARKILNAVTKPYVLDGNEVRVNGSLGAAIHPEHGDIAEVLLRNADRAMYMAKDIARRNDCSCIHIHGQAEPVAMRAEK